MIISSCKMAATARKADYHLRLVLRKIVCKPLWTKCASISNYLIHVMLSASPAPRRYAVDPLISCTIHAHVNITHYHMTATARKADYHLRNQAPQNCMQTPMDKMCKHQQLFDSRDAVGLAGAAPVRGRSSDIMYNTCSREHYALSHDSSHIHFSARVTGRIFPSAH